MKAKHDKKLEAHTLDEFLEAKEPLRRMDLPTDDRVMFMEEQPFDQVWLWTLMGIELMVMMIPLILTGQPFWAIFVAGMAMALTFGLLASIKLRTRIDEIGIHYKMGPFQWKERTILWGEMDQVYVRKYSPIKEYGGWGMRYHFRNGRAFNVKGNDGIQIVKKDGKKILLGTQMAEEVQRHLDRYPLTV